MCRDVPRRCLGAQRGNCLEQAQPMPEQLHAQFLELRFAERGQQVRIDRVALETVGILAEPLDFEPSANRHHRPLRDALPADIDEADGTATPITVVADDKLVEDSYSCLTTADVSRRL